MCKRESTELPTIFPPFGGPDPVIVTTALPRTAGAIQFEERRSAMQPDKHLRFLVTAAEVALGGLTLWLILRFLLPLHFPPGKSS